jgi:hypothetical protein
MPLSISITIKLRISLGGKVRVTIFARGYETCLVLIHEILRAPRHALFVFSYQFNACFGPVWISEGWRAEGWPRGRQTVQAHLLILLIHAHLARADYAPDLSVN